MAQLRTADDIKQLGTILLFWAHPDDETFSCAGIMATAIKNGQRVICVTATRGEEGVQDETRWPRERLGEIRTRELYEALEILGISDHHFLGYRDGTLERVSLKEGTGHCLEFIQKYRPDSILTFGPDGMTGHPDHKSVSHWVRHTVEALDSSPKVYHAVELRDHYERFMKTADEKFDIYFNIDKPPIKNREDCELCFTCPPDVCAQKCQALAAMPSQTEQMMRAYDETTLNEMFCTEAFVRAR